MKNYWKQFAGWGTGLRHNVFLWARIKLTFLYIGIIVVIVLVFSAVLIYSLDKNIRDNFEGNASGDQTQELAIANTTDQLQTTIIIIDFFVILMSSGLSYFLAGRTLRPIQKSLERQRRFTADASHELRTPLAVARADLEVALREKKWDQEKTRARIESAIEEVDKITKFTEDLLTLARFDNEKIIDAFQKTDVAQLLHRIVKKMEILAGDKGISLSFVNSSPTTVMGDASALERLFVNIIKNAIQFTPRGGSIKITTEHRDKKIAVSIRDTGVGIAEEDIPHVFERFYRADKARAHTSDGTGLGLSIVQEIVDAHSASIHIESKINEGTLVTVIFSSPS